MSFMIEVPLATKEDIRYARWLMKKRRPFRLNKKTNFYQTGHWMVFLISTYSDGTSVALLSEVFPMGAK